MSLFGDVFGLPTNRVHVCGCVSGPGRYGCHACGAPGWDTSPPTPMFINTTSKTTITTRKIKPEKPVKRVPASRAEEV